MEIEETQIPEHLLLSVMRNRPPREFKAYCVGLAKTGTTWIANIFRYFYSRHEYLNAGTGDMIKKFKNAVISKAVFRKFIINGKILS
jgi:hypothetical protein